MSSKSLTINTTGLSEKVIKVSFWGLLGSSLLLRFWLTTALSITADIILVFEMVKMLCAIVLGGGLAYDVYRRFSRNQLTTNNRIRIIIGVVVLLCLLMFAGQGYVSFDYVFLGVMVLGASHLNGARLVKTYAYICTGLLGIVMVICQFGLVPNLIYGADGYSRVSFGITYPTDFCAHVFFITMAFLFAKGNKVDIKDVTSLILFGLYCICFCRGRNTAICFFLAAFLMGVYWAVNKYKTSVLETTPIKGLGWLATLAAPILALFMIGISYAYDYFAIGSILYKADGLLSGRLFYGRRAFDRLSILPWGQDTGENGNGGSVSEALKPLYVHPEYVKIAIAGAVVLLFMMMAFFLVRKVKLPVFIGSVVVMTAMCFVGKVLLATNNFTEETALTYDEKILAIKEALNDPYFFLDCSYMSLLFGSGWVILVAVLIVYVLLSYKQFTSREWVRLLVLVVVAVQCTVEHHLMDLAYCPFFLMLLAANKKAADKETVKEITLENK